MDDKNKKTPEFEEPSYEDFLLEEEDPDRERKKKHHKKIIRLISGVVAFVFLLSSFTALSSVFNLPALEFLKTSVQLSQRVEIQQYKQAVVSIEGSNVKGTGFNIAEDGTIITNYHVIENMNPIVVYFNDGQVFKAAITQEYPEVDLAVLDIEADQLPNLPLSRENSLFNGDPIYVIGNPLSFYQIANQGEVIGLSKVNDIKVPVLTISAPIFRGNSGSPIINENGEVVGVVFASTIPRVRKREDRNGLAIPIGEVLSRLQ